MSCDIIIPVFNQKQYTEDCINSIKKNTLVDYRIIIVDDKSTDSGSLKFLSDIADEKIKIVHNQENLGWVKSVNRGIEESTAQYACIMNNDTIVTDGWLDEMIKIAQQAPDIGLVNPVWEKPDRVSIADYAQGLKKFTGEFVETDWVRGFCFLVKRELINKIGGLDEAYSPGYYDDWDFSVRAIAAGFRSVRAKSAYVYHHRNISHRKRFEPKSLEDLMEKNKQLFFERWGRPLRIIFLFNGAVAPKHKIEELLFEIARGQHHIYIWEACKNAPHIEHTNAKITRIAFFLFYAWALIKILNNLSRSAAKHYDMIFMQDKALFALFLKLGINKKVRIFLVDFNGENFAGEIKNMIAELKDERKINGSNLN